jgi:hypothetical protein
MMPNNILQAALQSLGLTDKPKMLLNIVVTVCALSEEDNPAITGGINMIACAKIIGITPEALSFKGIH